MHEKYVRKVTAWITQEQSDKIAESGLNDSVYIRESIDEKDLRLSDIKHRMKSQVIDELITHLSDNKEDIIRQTVRQNTPSNEEIVGQIYSQVMNVGQKNENMSDNIDENVGQNLEEIFGEQLQTVVNLLNSTGRLTPQQMTMISHKMGIKQKELRDLIDEHHDEILRREVKRSYS